MKKEITLIIFFISNLFYGQSQINSFLRPADTLQKNRVKFVAISETSIGIATLIGLNQLWYADYPKSNFHYIDDSSEWLQMDKVGHFYSCYQMGRLGYESLQWAGLNRKQRLIYGSTIGLAFMSAVEVMDGYSSQWGFSIGDEIANISGTSFFIAQELIWKEQRIIPKFSFHTTPYASANSNQLGKNFQEQILKDYNGQTYWLSANIYSFTHSSFVPKWLNVAFGYGAEGMITGKESFVNTIFLPESQRYRKYYLSLDVDLTKITTKSHTLKTLFSIFNTIKIPAPALEFKGKGGVEFHYIYF